MIVRFGLIAILVLLGGCGPVHRPYNTALLQPKELDPSPTRNCFDTIGHRSGASPAILGGNCYCTPSPAVISDYHAHGVAKEHTAASLQQLYASKGIKTSIDHRGCNNACQWGPHLIRGGYCMVPPTPGTQNYEEVARHVPNAATK